MSTSSFNFTKPEDFRVYGLEQKQPAYATFEGKMYAGMLPMDNGDRTGMTMFWMFQPDTQEVPDSIVLWLNGGYVKTKRPCLRDEQVKNTNVILCVSFFFLW